MNVLVNGSSISGLCQCILISSCIIRVITILDPSKQRFEQSGGIEGAPYLEGN